MTTTITLSNPQTVTLLKALALYVRHQSTIQSQKDTALEIDSMVTGLSSAQCLAAIRHAKIDL